ncbi:MAG: 16S rRNA (uracil(1498)-N(3))-methyltransferase [Eubacteriales bacterium]|nr:16S rRNA (uracil(1498)-N(3))-methyltransferase [Eubacteriales bacterium]
MPKFFTDKENIHEDTLHITGEDVEHLSRVYRAKVGYEIMVCDGCGTDYECVVVEIEKNHITAKIISQKECDTEPKVKITLFQGLPKQGKMEIVIQKTTELGITRIVPTITQRSVVKLNDGDTKKQQRWQKVAIEAAKQSGRGLIPEVTPVMSFEKAVEMASKMQAKIIPYELEKETSLRQVLSSDIREIGIIVGSEGGFDPEEIQLAVSKGITSVTLGKRILRTETVGTALLPVILYETGDM